VIIIDLICIDSENEFERSTRDNLYKPSFSPELKIIRSKYNNELISKQLKYKKKKKIYS
jgi:hypothetical protein